jgi:DNA-binding HxlR family transcriptional regulator
MAKYGQYCPIAKALDILGNRCTLQIMRDMLTGTRHINSLERGLPRIPRALLASRLQQLQRAGVIRVGPVASACQRHLFRTRAALTAAKRTNMTL